MKRLLPILLFATAAAAQVYRVDPSNVMTTSGTVPVGGFPALYAAAGSTVSVFTDAATTIPATTWTNGTGLVACPFTAQVTLAGTAACTTYTGPQGQFGFWLSAGTYYYTVTTPNGTRYGPYPITTATAAGITDVTAGNGISVTGTTSPLVSLLDPLYARSYEFTPQTNATNLIAGDTKIMLSPVPLGINWNTGNDNHTLYITGGLDSAGTCYIKTAGPGTAVSGDFSGTLTLYCAHQHRSSAGNLYSIQSGSAGIVEAYRSITDVTGKVHLSAGNHRIYGSIMFDSPVVLSGDGPGHSIIKPVVTDSGGFDAITVNPGASVLDIGNIGIIYDTWPTSPTAGITLNAGGPLVHLHDIRIYKPYVGIQMVSTSSAIVPNVSQIEIDFYKQGAIFGDATAGGLTGGFFDHIFGSFYQLAPSGTDSAMFKFIGTVDGLFVTNFSGGSGDYGAYISTGVNIRSNITFLQGLFEDMNAGFKFISAANPIGGGIIRLESVRVANGSTGIYQPTTGPTGPAFDFNVGISHDVSMTDCYSYGHPYGVYALGGHGFSIIGSHFHTLPHVAYSPFTSTGYAGIYFAYSAPDTNTNILISSTDSGFSNVSEGRVEPVPVLPATTIDPSQGVPLYGLRIDQPAARLNITGNALNGSTSNFLVNGSGITESVISNNVGIDDVVGTTASATALAVPINPTFTVTGTTGVTSVTGLWAGRTGTFITPDGAVTFTAGASIGNTITTVQNTPNSYYYDGTKLWIGGGSSGGSMTWPGAGVAVSLGSSWDTSIYAANIPLKNGSNAYTGYNDFSGGRARLPESTFASPPGTPVTGQVFLFTDASALGVCGGTGTSFAICRWSGAAWATVTGGGVPGGNTGEMQVNTSGSFAGQATVFASGSKSQRAVECSTGTIAYSALISAAQTQEVSILTGMTGKFRPVSVILQEATKFASSSITAASASMGRTSVDTDFIPYLSIMSAAAPQNFYADRPGPPILGTGTYTLVVQVTSDGVHNLGTGAASNFSAGALNWEVCGYAMP